MTYSATIARSNPSEQQALRLIEALGLEPIPTLRPGSAGQAESLFRYQNAEHFFRSIIQGIVARPRDLLYQSGIVIQLGISSHLLGVGFTDDWSRWHIGLHLTRSLAYANATGFDLDMPDLALLATFLSPYGKWRHADDDMPLPPFDREEIITITRALLDHVQAVTGHPRPSYLEA